MAFGETDSQILIEPILNTFYIQNIGFTISLRLFVDKPFDSFTIPLTPGDLLAYHAIGLGLHITLLVLLKGFLDGFGSKLMPDKIHFDFGFSCDGPGRGGTCDISSWDSFYLAMFWMVNTNAWIMFCFHWRHLLAFSGFKASRKTWLFDECSTYLNGWFRDYLWFNSAELIHGYNSFGINDLSIWSWLFLGAHLCWAISFMFLISWRGYWQELVDIIIYMHLKTPILYDIWNGGFYTPIAFI